VSAWPVSQIVIVIAHEPVMASDAGLRASRQQDPPPPDTGSLECLGSNILSNNFSESGYTGS